MRAARPAALSNVASAPPRLLSVPLPWETSCGFPVGHSVYRYASSGPLVLLGPPPACLAPSLQRSLLQSLLCQVGVCLKGRPGLAFHLHSRGCGAFWRTCMPRLRSTPAQGHLPHLRLGAAASGLQALGKSDERDRLRTGRVGHIGKRSSFCLGERRKVFRFQRTCVHSSPGPQVNRLDHLCR